MLSLLSHNNPRHLDSAAQDYFDPEAHIVTPLVMPVKRRDLHNPKKLKPPEQLNTPVRVPFIQAYFIKKHSDTPERAEIINQWRHYPDPNGLNCPEVMPPLVATAYADCVGIDVLLANPNINPNIDYRGIKYAGIVPNSFGTTPALRYTPFTDSACPSPLALVARKIVKDGAKFVSAAGRNRQPVDWEALADKPEMQRYLHACEQLMDVGARIDLDQPFPGQLMPKNNPESAEKLSKVISLFAPLQAKLDEMQARVAKLIGGEIDAGFITPQDLKHCYSLGRMVDLIGLAQVSDAVRDRLFDVHHQLPDWMQNELSPICAMLKPDNRVTSWAVFSRMIAASAAPVR